MARFGVVKEFNFATVSMDVRSGNNCKPTKTINVKQMSSLDSNKHYWTKAL